MAVNEVPISVLIVDDHLVVRQGLRVMISSVPDIRLVGEAENGEEAIERCAELHPDVVLMDMVMPVMDGSTAMREISRQFPEIRIIALTSFNDDKDMVRAALNAGAVGYLFKNVSADELIHAIRTTYAGTTALAPEIVRILVESRQEHSREDFNLSERELGVLALLVKGYSNAEIADALVVSLSTAKFHVRNVLAKLGAANRTEAVYIANEYKLLS